MIALDTNVLVRYLVQDDPIQSKAATDFVEETLTEDAPGFISVIVLCEIVWVLEDCYKVKRQLVVSIIEGFLSSRQLVLESAGVVRAALRHERVDVSDAIIHEIGRSRGCDRTVTFDRSFSRLDGVELLG